MLRFAMRAVFALLVLLVLVLAAFRIAAALRETESLAAGMPAEGRLVETARGRVFVLERGPVDGAPVLLVHGSVGWSGFWGGTLDALAAAGYRAIAADTPPMGWSERDPAGDYSRGTQADRLLPLVEALDARPVLVAHSFGAGHATEAAMRAPEAFAGYVMVAGAVGIGLHDGGRTLPPPLHPRIAREAAISATVTNPLALRPMLAAFLHRKEAATPGQVAILRRPLSRRGTTPALARWLPSLLVPPVDAASTRREAYRALALPTEVIWGAEDTATPLAQGEEIAALVPGARLTVLPGIGHIPQIEDPPAFHAALLAALGRLADP